jgi:hypothetical protein
MIALLHPTIRLALLILATLTTTYTEGAGVPLFDGKVLSGGSCRHLLRAT